MDISTQKQDKEFENKLQKETNIDIEKIEQDFKKNKNSVVNMLIDTVLHVDLSIPNSVKEKFENKTGFIL